MPASAPDPGRRNERSRRAILDASIALIGELGDDDVSIQATAGWRGSASRPSTGGGLRRAVVLEAATHRDVVADLRTHRVEPNIEAFGRRITLAQERGEVRADADVQALRDLLYGVIEYRLAHRMPIKPRYLDAVLTIAFQGVR